MEAAGESLPPPALEEARARKVIALYYQHHLVVSIAYSWPIIYGANSSGKINNCSCYGMTCAGTAANCGKLTLGAHVIVINSA